MRRVHTLLKRAVATGALLTAAYAVASVSSAQDAAVSTTTTTPTTSTADAKAPPTTATPQMIADAVARSKARHDKFLAAGTPEEFGSEEPYTPK
jgi:hypothetical protein